MQDLKKIKYHFLLAKERTASSLVVTMLNQSSNILSVSEETFGLYLFDKYRAVEVWEEADLVSFVDDFILMHKKNLSLFMGEEHELRSLFLKQKGKRLSVEELVKLVYLNFYPQKDKSEVTAIIDKQIDYLFHIPELIERFPDSRFVILVRDPVTNVESCVNRKLNGSDNVVFHAELWNTYYENVLAYAKDERFLIVKYEELISDPEGFLRKVCGHYELDYTKDLLDVEGALDELFAVNSGRVSADFEEEFRDFHKGLFQKVSEDYGKEKKRVLDQEEIRKVKHITQSVSVSLGYHNENSGCVLSSLEVLQQKKARLAKKRLLDIYWRIPIEMKLWIKKNRRQTIDV